MITNLPENVQKIRKPISTESIDAIGYILAALVTAKDEISLKTILNLIHRLYTHPRSLATLKNSGILQNFLELKLFDEIELLLSKKPAGLQVGDLLDVLLSTKNVDGDEKIRVSEILGSLFAGMAELVNLSLQFEYDKLVIFC